MSKFPGFLIILLLFLSSYSYGQKKSSGRKSPPKEISTPKKKVLHGVASFYAAKFTGRRTANGEIYDPDKLTAACNVLPLNTWIRVTNLRNHRSVIVKVNDRLYYKNKRIVDLSRTAARKLGFLSYGITKVTVEVVHQKDE
jgi:rare lipoprotein A